MYFEELVGSYEASRRERDVFHDLMGWRVREVLLVASLYDSFVVESDGILNEQIYGEYYRLNLNNVPRITSAYTAEAALELFRSGSFDVAILMAGLDFDGPLALARAMKEAWPSVPVLLMVTNNSSLERLDLARPELAAVDRVFVWNGYSKLFVGMLKYIEDARNAAADTKTGLIRVVLLIEDSVRYYSRYLPLLYQVAMRQTQGLIEGEKGGDLQAPARASEAQGPPRLELGGGLLPLRALPVLYPHRDHGPELPGEARQTRRPGSISCAWPRAGSRTSRS